MIPKTPARVPNTASRIRCRRRTESLTLLGKEPTWAAPTDTAAGVEAGLPGVAPVEAFDFDLTSIAGKAPGEVGALLVDCDPDGLAAVGFADDGLVC